LNRNNATFLAMHTLRRESGSGSGTKPQEGFLVYGLKELVMARGNFLAIVAVVLAGLVMTVAGGCKERQPAGAAPSGSGTAVSAAFANAKCPIMGARIVPERVSANLIRQYKDEKVAFCCAGCPEKWDGLSDQDKAAKLAAAK
jgi:hypothetical protein